MFRDREEAGEALAKALKEFRNRPNSVVLGLPRGGLIVARAVSQELNLPLDVFLSQKIHSPWNPEVAIGAVTETGYLYLDEPILEANPIPESVLQEEIQLQKIEIDRRRTLYRAGRPLPRIARRTILLIDDGVATGATLIAAAKVLRGLEPAFLAAAAPVGPNSLMGQLDEFADLILFLEELAPFYSVSQHYRAFKPVEDEKILRCLKLDAARH